MTSRERVMKALNFEATDRLPRDLGGMRSTGISAFAYPKLVAALGLPPRRPKVHDTGQMLALPDIDVLDALGCDVVTAENGVTNAFEEPEKWHDYDFGGRLAARVRNPADFQALEDGTIVQGGSARMVPGSYVFDGEHGGQPILAHDQDLPKPDLEQYDRYLAAAALTEERIRDIAGFLRRVRESTDRAVFCPDLLGSRMGIGAHGGIGIFPMLCLLEPDYVRELHEVTIGHVLADVRALLPEIRDYVDIVMTHCDDWGTQNTTIASPDVYRTLFLPYLRRLNDEVHRLAPAVKTFIHTCGAVYDLLDLFVESGFDIINPVQWPAGGHSFREWKDKVRGRASLWGGGVNAQHTLSLGSVEDVEREVREVCAYLRQDGGYVFNNIHNLLAEVPPEKIIAMYRTAGEF